MLTSHRAESQSEFTGQGRAGVGQTAQRLDSSAQQGRAMLCRSAKGPREGQPQRGEATPALARHCFLSPCRLCFSVGYPKAWARWVMSPHSQVYCEGWSGWSGMEEQ